MHRYRVVTNWTGNLGTGTSAYRAYSRDHEISGDGKTAPIRCSSDPAFRGDGQRYNPEELLVAALSTCHMLWVLHLAADAGIVISDYRDEAEGEMEEQFQSVTLRPKMTITDGARIADAEAIHHRAHELCFIARSVNFPVRCEPEIHLLRR
ncbi:MAG: OsmC family protein [Bryobacteraceae bacterium]|nr:OsmC family protein [Bryobacteraceae bacterium]